MRSLWTLDFGGSTPVQSPESSRSSTQWSPFATSPLTRLTTTPKSNKPFTTPFLAHTTFQRDTEQWLCSLARHHFHHIIPFHPPTNRVREAAHKTLRSKLCNHKQWESEDHFSSPPTAQDMPCSCHHMHSLLRDPDNTQEFMGRLSCCSISQRIHNTTQRMK